MTNVLSKKDIYNFNKALTIFKNNYSKKESLSYLETINNISYEVNFDFKNNIFDISVNDETFEFDSFHELLTFLQDINSKNYKFLLSLENKYEN